MFTFMVTHIHMITHQNPNTPIQLHYPTRPNTHTHSCICTHTHTNTSCTYTLTSIVTHTFMNTAAQILKTHSHKHSHWAPRTAAHPNGHGGARVCVHACVCRAAKHSCTQHGAHSHPRPCSGPDPGLPVPFRNCPPPPLPPRRPHGQGTMNPHGDFKDLKTPPQAPSEFSTQGGGPRSQGQSNPTVFWRL